MKEVQGYRCSYCGKIYIKKTACLKHEETRCLRNLANRPLCYDCQHYRPCGNDDDKEAITCYSDAPCGEFSYEKLFSPNKCEKKNLKLFNNIKLIDDIVTALWENGYEPMPLPKDGCEYYELKTYNN